MISISISVIG